MRVLLLSRYGRMGASTRVRSLQYLPYLQAHGFDIDVAPLLDDDYLAARYAGHIPIGNVVDAYAGRAARLLSVNRYDLIWVEKEIFPWIPAQVSGILLPKKIPHVLDYDDAQFHRYDMNSSRLVRIFLGKSIDKLMRGAAMVIVGNDYLAERALRAGVARVERLPTVVDLSRYSMVAPAPGKPLTVGWIGTPRTSRYLDPVLGVLADAAKRWKLRMVAVGAAASPPIGFPVEAVPWTEDTEVAKVQDFDIGIMPLPDDPFERGKSGYKLIQYMACGKPVIASPVGVNGKIVEHGLNGFLATDAREWTTALNALCADRDLRETMGRAGRKMVEEKFCLQVTAPQLAALLREAAGT